MKSSPRGVVFVYLGDDRSPAATHNMADYYPVEKARFQLPKEKQVFDALNYLNRPNELGVRLGHLLIQEPSGRVRFACEVQSRASLYDRVELSFTGVGVSEDGRTPSMTVDSDCRAETDPLQLTPIWLPMSQIYQSEPHAREMEFSAAGGASVHLHDLASVWPERWSLVKVRIYHSSSGIPGIILTPGPQSRPAADALSFDWQKH